jgi:hypothetical protein
MWDQQANESRAKPVVIRDVEYPSQAAAARAMGVTPQAIRWAQKYGSLDRIGTVTRYRVGDYPKLGDNNGEQRYALD